MQALLAQLENVLTNVVCTFDTALNTRGSVMFNEHNIVETLKSWDNVAINVSNAMSDISMLKGWINVLNNRTNQLAIDTNTAMSAVTLVVAMSGKHSDLYQQRMSASLNCRTSLSKVVVNVKLTNEIQSDDKVVRQLARNDLETSIIMSCKQVKVALTRCLEFLKENEDEITLLISTPRQARHGMYM